MRPHPPGAAAARVAPGGNAIAHRLQPPIRPNPTGPSPASPSRNRPRTARRQLWPATVLVALLTALLAACSGPTVPSGHPLQVWDRAELDAVLDLRSLGRFTIATDGTVLLGGKILDPALVSTQAYGRRLNLLQLSPDLLEALPSELAKAYIHATAEDIRAGLEAHAVTLKELRAAQQGGVSLEDYATLASLSALRTGDTTLLQALNLPDRDEGVR